MSEGLRARLVRESARRKLFGAAADAVVFGEYTLIDYLGGGGMGEVFRAYDPSLDRNVAIKVVRTDIQSGDERGLFEERLLREARAMARIEHPNVVTVHRADRVDDERVFIAMQHVGGGTLRDWSSEKPRLWSETVGIYLQAGEGLAAAHGANLIHRDFKPDNVLISEDRARAYVTDFGLAGVRARSVSIEAIERAIDDAGDRRLTVAGELVGTPAYMAPEQMTGAETDARQDQYAFCVALYEGLFGRLPFPEAGAFVSAKLEGRLRRPATKAVPEAILEVIMRGLRVNPWDRYPTMNALLDALASAADTQRTSRRAPRSQRRGALIAAVAGLGLVGALAAFVPVEPPPSAAPVVVAPPKIEIVDDADLRRKLEEALERNRGLEAELNAMRVAVERINARTKAATVAVEAPPLDDGPDPDRAEVELWRRRMAAERDARLDLRKAQRKLEASLEDSRHSVEDLVDRLCGLCRDGLELDARCQRFMRDYDCD